MPYMLRGLVILTMVTFFAIVTTGCSTTSSDKKLRPISVLDAQELVQERKRLLGLGGTEVAAWVDSRPEIEFRAEHIPGAINLPYERVTLDHKTLDAYDVIVVYGNDYNDSRANGMSKRLMELGHSNVHTLTGGLRAWKTEGNPVETSQP